MKPYRERRKNMTQWAEWAKELKTQLYIKTEIIGFKRFEDPDEID